MEKHSPSRWYKTAEIALFCVLLALLAFYTNYRFTLITENLSNVQAELSQSSSNLALALNALQASTTKNISAAMTVAQKANLASTKMTAVGATNAMTTAVSAIAPAVVSIEAYPADTTSFTQSQEVSAGSGFVVSASGFVVTNKHVVADSTDTYVVVLANGTQKVGTVVYRDPYNDVAMLKIAGTYTAAAMGNSDTLQAGQTVAALGNALGKYENSVSVGSISGLNRTINATGNDGSSEYLTGMIQTDAGINPGNSGGPLIDANGTVIGVAVATVSGSSNISFAIPINQIKDTVALVISEN